MPSTRARRSPARPTLAAAAPAAEAPAPSAAAEDDTTDCAICLRPVREGVRLRGGQQYTCTHVFHTHCFEEWSQTNQSCPICRSPVGRPARSPVRRRPPAVTTEGHFFVQLPDEFHNQAMRDAGRSFLVITHYQRLLDHIVPDFVHVLSEGQIVKSGPKELALELEEKGYDWIKEPAV